jgi:hypothetical protein
MYGAFSGMTFGLVSLVAMGVIALAVFASPLIAVLIALVAACFLLIGMSALRQRSAGQDQSEGGAPDTHSSGPRARGTSGKRASGAPVSGEG